MSHRTYRRHFVVAGPWSITELDQMATNGLQGWFDPGCMKFADCRAVPRYGWNPLRWLFGRPRWWKVTYTFEAVQEGVT